ncbi:DUF1016 N-terminal domain-containing protein [Microbacterium bandirmense]|uniref:DUF1016 N-terminal domain-containing protein n=1 Tax=Microbacterium bandirmense TaxID=3122050 RepID=UPI003B289CD7
MLVGLKERVRESRYRAQRHVNTELVALNWHIGQVLAERTADVHWGAKIILRLSTDLPAKFPDSGGSRPASLPWSQSATTEARRHSRQRTRRTRSGTPPEWKSTRNSSRSMGSWHVRQRLSKRSGACGLVWLIDSVWPRTRCEGSV